MIISYLLQLIMIKWLFNPIKSELIAIKCLFNAIKSELIRFNDELLPIKYKLIRIKCQLIQFNSNLIQNNAKLIQINSFLFIICGNLIPILIIGLFAKALLELISFIGINWQITSLSLSHTRITPNHVGPPRSFYRCAVCHTFGGSHNSCPNRVVVHV